MTLTELGRSSSAISLSALLDGANSRSPDTSTSLGELVDEVIRGGWPGLRDHAPEHASSNVVIMFRGLDEVGNKAFAEWLIEADHTGPLVLDENAVLDATGRHVRLAGVTVADFRDGKIRSYRTYFDDLSLIEQLVGA